MKTNMIQILNVIDITLNNIKKYCDNFLVIPSKATIQIFYHKNRIDKTVKEEKAFKDFLIFKKRRGKKLEANR